MRLRRSRNLPHAGSTTLYRALDNKHGSTIDFLLRPQLWRDCETAHGPRKALKKLHTRGFNPWP